MTATHNYIGPCLKLYQLSLLLLYTAYPEVHSIWCILHSLFFVSCETNECDCHNLIQLLISFFLTIRFGAADYSFCFQTIGEDIPTCSEGRAYITRVIVSCHWHHAFSRTNERLYTVHCQYHAQWNDGYSSPRCDVTYVGGFLPIPSWMKFYRTFPANQQHSSSICSTVKHHYCMLSRFVFIQYTSGELHFMNRLAVLWNMFYFLNFSYFHVNLTLSSVRI